MLKKVLFYIGGRTPLRYCWRIAPLSVMWVRLHAENERGELIRQQYLFSGVLPVTAVSANNIWAVGLSNNYGSGATQTLIEHWNSSKWSVVTSPNIGTGSNDLESVAAISSNNVWAVGSGAINTSSSRQTVIEHWDGTKWSIISSSNIGQGDNMLSGVAAISANDIWAAGNSLSGLSNTSQTLIEHWDGSSWSIISSPNVANLSNRLSGITWVSSGNVWAEGYSTNGASSSSTLIEHWDGMTWSIVPSPNPTSFSMLQGITRLAATNNVWVVGLAQISSGATQTFIESYC